MFEPRLAAASLSGRSDAEWAAAAEPYVGAAFLGGIALDEATREAARAMVERDRTEFLPPDPIGFIREQLEACRPLDLQPAFNVRTIDLDRLRDAAEACHHHDAIIEINAHCRQDEVCAVGAGEALLQAPDRLRSQVATAAGTGAVASVKVRTEVDGVDLPALTSQLTEAGASIVHIDAMDSEPVVADVAAVTDAFIIANNGVRGRRTVAEYLEFGADAVSVGRPSDDPTVLERVNTAVEDLFPTQQRPETAAASDNESF